MDNPESRLSLPEVLEPGVTYDHNCKPIGSEIDSASEDADNLTDGECDSNGSPVKADDEHDDEEMEDPSSCPSNGLSINDCIAYLNDRAAGTDVPKQNPCGAKEYAVTKIIKGDEGCLVDLGEGIYFERDRRVVLRVVDFEDANDGYHEAVRRHKYGLPDGMGFKVLWWWSPKEIRQALEEVSAEVPDWLTHIKW
jgi:hypothetical protein